MGLKVNQNSPSMFINRQHAINEKTLKRAFERLSSGLRINSAADDVAGLSISGRFESQIRGVSQAMRNANDGISMTQTADAAASSVTDNLQRIRELSIQAANGTLTKSDRSAIQSEIDQLLDENNRIAETTTFNGRPLLAGNTAETQLQVGATPGETVSLPGGDLRSDQLGTAAVVSSDAIAQNGIATDDLSINDVDIRATTNADDTLSTVDGSGSAIALAAAINDASEFTGVSAQVEATTVESAIADGGSLDAANSLTINGAQFSDIDVQAGDAGNGLIDAINDRSDETGVTAARIESGGIELTAQDGRNIEIEVTGNAESVTGLSTGVAKGTVTLESADSFEIAGNAVNNSGFASGFVGQNSQAAASSIDVTTVEGANNAIDTVDRAIGQVSRLRSRFGATQNRLESTVSNLANVSENIQAANSRITDADFAAEVAAMINSRILEQAQISLMGQANTGRERALSLLGST